MGVGRGVGYEDIRLRRDCVCPCVLRGGVCECVFGAHGHWSRDLRGAVDVEGSRALGGC